MFKRSMLGDEALEREELVKLFFKLLEKPYAKKLMGVLKDLFVKLLGDDNSLWSVTLGNVLRREKNVYKAFEEHESLFASWARRYLQYFGIKNPNFKNLFIPKGGKGRLIVNVLKTSIFDSHEGWGHLTGELHLAFGLEPKEISRPSVGYSAWIDFSGEKETCSAKSLMEESRSNLYIEDVILFLIAYFEETGEKFSMEGINVLCPGSRDKNGDVVLIAGSKDSVTFELVADFTEQYNLSQPRKTH